MLRLPIALLPPLAKSVCCAPIVVCIQTTIGLPANDYWSAPPSRIATQLPPAIFPFYYPDKRTSSPLKHLVLPPEKHPLPHRIRIFFAPCKCLAYGEMSATLAGGLRNILREDLVCI